MIQFPKPVNLNGAELLDELEAVGIVLDRITQIPKIDGNGNFWLDVDPADEVKAREVVAAHNGTTIAPDPTIQDKLASVGVNFTDLKSALGL